MKAYVLTDALGSVSAVFYGNGDELTGPKIAQLKERAKACGYELVVMRGVDNVASKEYGLEAEIRIYEEDRTKANADIQVEIENSVARQTEAIARLARAESKK